MDPGVEQQEHGILLVGPNENTLSTVTERLVGEGNTSTRQRSVLSSVTIERSASYTLLNGYVTRAVYTVDNKYYSADIPVGWCLDLSRMLGDSRWPAIVFVLDPETVSFFDEMVLWWESMSEYKVDIPLVVAWGLCRDTHASFVGRVMEWCIDHGFELIEIDHPEDEEVECQDRDRGMARLEDALQAHAWPHAFMKRQTVPDLTRTCGGEDAAPHADLEGQLEDLDTDPDHMMFEKMMAITQRTCTACCSS